LTALPPSWIRSPLRALRQRLAARAHPPAKRLAAVEVDEFFRRKADEQGYTLSHGQQRVIACMAEQAAHLADGTARSLYLYGAVGRGKSWLLDGFFQSLEHPHKRRLHFHDFFAQLHEGMFRHRQQDDALGATLDELLKGCQVLCFDEFHVHDIGDAMLITGLFKALFERRVFVLLTSNYPPAGLLPNPLYHQRFEPVIRLIEAHMQVLEVGGEQDYRSHPASGSQQRFTQGHYLWPGSPAQRHAAGLDQAGAPVRLQVGKRSLHALFSQERAVGFSFEAICEQPTAVMDYLELARRYDHWVIEHLPDLAQCSMAAQQRFINLVDVLYDQDKHLVLVGQASLCESLGGSAIDLARTRSRLGQLNVLGPVACPG